MYAHAAHPGASARPRLSPLGLGAVIALHALVLVGLVRLNVIPLPTPLAVLSVSLLPPAHEARPQPEIVLPRPKPVERRAPPVQQPMQQLATPPASPAPAPIAVAPAPPAVAAPAPIVAAPVAAPTQPRFDADYLDNPKPAYPAISRRLNEQGRVTLRVHVAADGSAREIQLHTTSGSSRLDQSALTTVQRWKFVPARLGQEAVAAWVLVPIAFTLKD